MPTFDELAGDLFDQLVAGDAEAPQGELPDSPEDGTPEQPEVEATTEDDTGTVEADEHEAAEEPDDTEPEAEDQPETGPIKLSEGDRVVLPDGSEIDIKDAALRQADYTRKTQELSELRKEVEERERGVTSAMDEVEGWLAAKAQDPSAWASELLGQTDNPTLALAHAIKRLNDAGQLDQQFIDVFGLEAPDNPVNATGNRAAEDSRVAALEARLEQREKAEQASTRQAMVLEHYRRQWEDVKATESLTFDTPEAEANARLDLLKFARDNQITDLTKAHAAQAWERHKASQAEAQKAAPPAMDKKRATRAVTPKSAASGPTPKKPSSLEDVISQVVADKWAS